MAEAKRRLITAPLRMSFAKVVTPEAYKENGKAKGDPKYSVECIIDTADMAKFYEDDGNGGLVAVDLALVCSQVAKDKWGADFSVKDNVAAGKLHWPIVNGDVKITAAIEKATKAGKTKDPKSLDHYKGKKVIRAEASQEYPPVLSVRAGKAVAILNRASDADMNKAKQAFKGGNYGLAEITVAAIETAQGRYLKFYLNGLRMERAGEPIGAGGGMMSRYDGINGGSSDHDPLANGGMDDDIPF